MAESESQTPDPFLVPKALWLTFLQTFGHNDPTFGQRLVENLQSSFDLLAKNPTELTDDQAEMLDQAQNLLKILNTPFGNQP